MAAGLEAVILTTSPSNSPAARIGKYTGKKGVHSPERKQHTRKANRTLWTKFFEPHGALHVNYSREQTDISFRTNWMDVLVLSDRH